ncbi:cytochrome-c peroxidase [Exilibacterium tricleocarpae]|uniref:Cytochrome-c peroxidase n=2 Tax=Exilibacterium tricleocarpae TaxID=2591008 RepID=A0A545SZ27_9GAMM|nr:cytochrome-c peroxidase [Exilibacterium tricleocarpae]
MLPVLSSAAATTVAAPAGGPAAVPELAQHCPPGFELRADNGCYLRSFYRDLPSLQNAGVGGPQTGLPALREGFSPQQIDLGRLLFFDPLLSADHTIACASCHQPHLGFADGRGRSVGIGGQVVSRSAPSLWNVGLLKRFFWDGRATSLEQQAVGPLFAADEMGNSPARLQTDLNGTPAYVALFRQVFDTDTIALEQVYLALAAFQSSLISLNSRYDLYAQGFEEALTPAETEGMNIFRSFVARCAECHTPPLFTNQQIAVLGTPEPEGLTLDIGAEGPSGDPSQRGGFKVPSLRNITLTAPYMHSGRFATLREAVEFYNKGRGHAVPEGEKLSLHWHIWEPQLEARELDRLVDFLGALTDEGFKPAIPAAVPSGLPVPVLSHSKSEQQ